MRGLSLILTISCMLVASLLGGCAGCTDSDNEQRPRPTREQFIKYNRYLVHCDSVCIAQYSDSLGLNPNPSSTNLWMTIHNPGHGDLIKNGDKVSMEYVVTTLLGDTLYSSAHDGIKNVVAGQCDMNIGIDEALSQLRKGADATVILIPEKAYGVRGDGNAISGRMILRYDLKLLEQ